MLQLRAVLVILIVRGVTGLVVERDAREGIIAPVEARPTLHDILLHLGLGARSTGEVSITLNWRKRRNASGEVVSGQRRDCEQ